MKILFVSHYSFLYGSNRSLDSIIDYFINKGEFVEVLLPSKGKFYEHLIGKGVKVHTFRFFYEVLYVKWNKKYLVLPILWLYNILSFPFLLFKVWKIAPEVIYSNSSVDAFSIFVAKLLHCRHVYHVREFLDEDFGSKFLFGKKAKRKLILWSDKIIFVSKAVANSVIGEVPPNGKVIYNGLSPAQNVKTFIQLDYALKLGVVGNIDISKQQHLAIKFMSEIHKKYPQMTLHIVGDKKCPYKHYIKKLVEQLKLTDVVYFEGFIGNVDEIYNRFDVLLMCSRAEAFGRVTIEAMLRNIPVIGYDRGGTSELIEEGITGFKFKTLQDVLTALDIITCDSSKVQYVIKNARNSALAKYSEVTYVTNVYNFVNGHE